MTLCVLVIVRGRLSFQALFTNMAVEIGIDITCRKNSDIKLLKSDTFIKLSWNTKCNTVTMCTFIQNNS